MKSDAEIQKDVIEELNWEPFLEATQIGVTVKNGIVTLSGTVDSYLKKSIAENAARRVGGVKAVAEDIEIKYSDSLTKNDSEIAEAIINALKWHSAINENKINVKVENGVVTLNGGVEWEYQRSAAVSQIENLVGVRRIINNIEVKGSQPVKDIKERIREALHRSASIDAEKIDVKTKGDTVTLSGTVRSWTEREDAENAVWSAPGIINVVNNLEIEEEVFVD